jgi:hypothetical protein
MPEKNEHQLVLAFLNCLPEGPSNAVTFTVDTERAVGAQLMPLHWDDTYAAKLGSMQKFMLDRPAVFCVREDGAFYKIANAEELVHAKMAEEAAAAAAAAAAPPPAAQPVTAMDGISAGGGFVPPQSQGPPPPHQLQQQQPHLGPASGGWQVGAPQPMVSGPPAGPSQHSGPPSGPGMNMHAMSMPPMGGMNMNMNMHVHHPSGPMGVSIMGMPYYPRPMMHNMPMSMPMAGPSMPFPAASQQHRDGW